ncbi:ABC transporter permease [Antarcticimicrobium luteum]|uniref:ABC transporter permease n=1 Tax=Antarcticimicrobium luteum TaxID=2547397 RepID=A0A4R5VFL1_9RHOB|nr:ABC transporter permease [Antarcticimicrobium luteum]TDK51393.1 ABC transporter permease [Antarcticimicrobium luteum]
MAGDMQSARGTSRLYQGKGPWLLLPAWAVIGIFLLLPVCLIVVYSFLTKEFHGGVIPEPSLAAYDQFFFDRGIFGDDPPRIEWNYIEIYLLSFLQAGLATLFCLVIGLPSAWYIATRPIRLRQMLILVITVPYWVNLLIRTISLKFLIRDEGPMNAFLQWTGLLDHPLHLVNTSYAVQLGLFYSYLPFMVLPIFASAERFDIALSEASADLYSTKWQTFRLITLPTIWPGVVAGSILVFVPSLGAFLAPNLLGGAKTYMIGSLIDEQFKGAAGNWPFGAAAATILMSVVLVVLILNARSQIKLKGAG